MVLRLEEPVLPHTGCWSPRSKTSRLPTSPRLSELVSTFKQDVTVFCDILTFRWERGSQFSNYFALAVQMVKGQNHYRDFRENLYLHNDIF